MSIPKFCFILFLIGLFTSCDGQVSVELGKNKNKAKGQNQRDSLGDRVSDIGSGFLTFYEDSKGILWLANDHLYRYDGDRLIRFSEKDGLPKGRIAKIDEDQNGVLYINIAGSIKTRGVWKFNVNGFEKLKVKKEIRSSDWKLQPNDLWFMADFGENLVYRYDGEWLIPLSFSNHPLEKDYFDAFSNPSFSPFGVYSIMKDSSGYPWFGTSAAGACRYVGEKFIWILEENVMELNPGPAPGVRSMLEDKNGHYWFSNDILHRYKIEDNTYSVLAGIDTVGTSGMPFSFMSITEGVNGDFWMTTYNEGVWHFDGEEVVYYPVKKDGHDVELYSIFADRKGEIWLGTHNDGVYRFNGEIFKRFTANPD